MDFFFKPRGVALIGATANPHKGGYAIFRNLISGFKGGIYPVNPRYSEIEGTTCYSSVLQVPDPVDLAIVFISAAWVPQVVRECAQRGIQGVMIQSAGFAESGEAGKQLQDQLVEIRQQTGIRIWGPNCMGLVDGVNGQVFSFMLPAIWEVGLVAGNVSLIVQSGMLSAGFLIDMMTHGTMGVSKACSIGNKVDVNECDVLAYLIDDADTATIGLYLESIPDGRRFTDLCRRSDKPIVVLRGGKSKKGAEAAISHTASLAGNGAAVSGSLAQVGVIEAYDFKQMMDLCRTLAQYPDVDAGKSGRVAILTMSGAAGIVSSDFIEKEGLAVADLSQGTLAALKKIYPEWMPVSNPIDLWPAAEINGRKKAFSAAFRAVCEDPQVDAILLHFFVFGKVSGASIAQLVQMAKDKGKPVFCWLMGKQDQAQQFQLLTHQLGIPAFRELGRAVECMAAVFGRKKHPAGGQIAGLPAGPIRMNERLRKLIRKESGALDENLSKQILASVGIPVVAEEIVASSGQARAASGKLGLPVVMKGLLPGEIHKTELGLVRTGITSPEEVENVFKTLQNRMSNGGKVLLQKHLEGYPELIAGLIRDSQFGLCVMCGFGGIFTEILADSMFAMAPLSHADALGLIGRLKTQKLLNGFRGSQAVDRDALADILVRLGELGSTFQRIHEIDINPLIVSSGKPIAVDATIILAS